MMCELPSNALLADRFLEHFDGFSIGSNDMTQLTLGVDRDSGGPIAATFDERDDAVKAMLGMAIDACRRRGRLRRHLRPGPVRPSGPRRSGWSSGRSRASRSTRTRSSRPGCKLAKNVRPRVVASGCTARVPDRCRQQASSPATAYDRLPPECEAPSMNRQHPSRRSRPFDDRAFLLLVVVVSVAFGWVVAPFFSAVFWSTVLAILFMPLHRRLVAATGGRASLSALATVGVILVIVILPAALVIAALVQEAASLVARVKSGELDFAAQYQALLKALPPWIAELCHALRIDRPDGHSRPPVRKRSRHVPGGRGTRAERRPEHVRLPAAARRHALRALLPAARWRGPRAPHSRRRAVERRPAAGPHGQVRHRDSRHRQGQHRGRARAGRARRAHLLVPRRRSAGALGDVDGGALAPARRRRRARVGPGRDLSSLPRDRCGRACCSPATAYSSSASWTTSCARSWSARTRRCPTTSC